MLLMITMMMLSMLMLMLLLLLLLLLLMMMMMTGCSQLSLCAHPRSHHHQDDAGHQVVDASKLQVCGEPLLAGTAGRQAAAAGG
jgi:hypothetical protein